LVYGCRRRFGFLDRIRRPGAALIPWTFRRPSGTERRPLSGKHAYYLQYKNVKADRVRAYWKLVDGEDVARRLRAVRSLDLAL
jgi:hypothetical protein